MKTPLFTKFFSTIAMLACLISPAKAALITTNFSDLVGNQGTVDIQLSIADAEVLEGFQVFFSDTLFSNLSIIESPANWDSYIIELTGPGFAFDNFNIDGLFSGHAKIAFTYIGQLPIQLLNYSLYDADFNETGSGVASNVQSTVPESSSLILMLLGVCALSARRLLRKVNVSGVAA